ncbi:HAD family hydrolase [Sphingomonas bisphenolicum]|nr:hypothetical protein [Sphingomonas bisphenolicum]
MATKFMADRMAHSDLPAFCIDWSYSRFDQVLGAWTPYSDLLRESLRPTFKVWGGEYREADADSAYEVIPTWGPHDDVPAGLSKIAGDIPLVIPPNAMDEHIDRNVGLLGAPFHAIYTAQMAQAQKPRMIGFDYIFDQLGCGPEDMMHVSSSFRYDLHFGDIPEVSLPSFRWSRPRTFKQFLSRCGDSTHWRTPSLTWPVTPILRPRLVGDNQKITVAARAMAEKKVRQRPSGLRRTAGA